MKPTPEALNELVKKTLIPHTAFQEGREILEDLFNQHQRGDVGGVAVYGESGSGKSSLRSLFLDRYPLTRTEAGLYAPVMSVCMPTAPTVKALSETILRKLDDPQFDKGTAGELEERAGELSRTCGVRMMFIEEFHQVFNPARTNYMYNFGEFLKNFTERSGALLVPVGLPHGEYAIKKNEQLTRRMMAPIRLPRFDWNDEESREEFTAILEAMYRSIDRYLKMPEIHNERIAFMFYCASGGIIGFIAKILEQAVKTAVTKNVLAVNIDDLARAHLRCMDPDDFVVRRCSPFSQDFKPKVDVQFLSRVARIGVRPEDAPSGFVKVRRRGPRQDMATVDQI